MSKVLKKKIYQYTAFFEPDKESDGYTVTVPSLPGCISEGDSFEQATRNIQEAVILYLNTMKQMNKNIIKEEVGMVIAPVQVKV